MNAANTTRAYGWAARVFHWTVAVLILAALGLGLYASNLPRGGEAELQAVFAAFPGARITAITTQEAPEPVEAAAAERRLDRPRGREPRL